MVILVRDVQFQHGEFRVVRAVHALVPEVARELINTFKAAHDEPLEVQFVGNAQVQRDVERVVVGHKTAAQQRPGMACSTGVSTSNQPAPSKDCRMVCMTLDRASNVAFTSGLTTRST